MIKLLRESAIALKESVLNFGDYSIPKKSASLAYYTLFAIAPLIYLILTLGSIFLGPEVLTNELFENLRTIVGKDISNAIRQILVELSLSDDSKLASFISFGVLLVVASGVFVEIQDSINDIWLLDKKPSGGLMKLLKDRLISFSLIAALGFLLLVSLVISSILDVLSARLADYFNTFSVVFAYILNNVILLGIISFLFYVIFKVLPDTKLSNKVSFTGAFVTTLLFIIGKTLISFYLSQSNLSSVFGSGGTLVILLSWVYYSSMILYFGAAFTKNLAIQLNEKGIPKKPSS